MQLKTKGAGILKQTASNSNKPGGPYKAKKSLGNVMRIGRMRDARNKKLIDMQEEMANPPPISEEDISKGMANLLNKGIIPKDVDLTPAFEKGAPPVQYRGMKFHDKAEMNQKQEIFTEKFNKNALRFDLQPVNTANLALDPINPSDAGMSMALVPVGAGSTSQSGSPLKAISGQTMLALPAP